MRKSFKIAPGVRMNVSTKSLGLSAGVKGARISANSSGRVTRTVGIPGTGISHVKTVQAGGRSRASKASSSTTAAARTTQALAKPKKPKPGLFAPAWEKKLYKQVEGAANSAMLQQIGKDYPEAAPSVAMVELHRVCLPASDAERSRAILDWLWTEGYDPATDKFFISHVADGEVTVPIATGVTVTLPLERQTLGLILAELEQDAGNADRAISIVEGLEPTTVAAVSLAELYAETDRWEEIINMTDGLTNDDEPSTYLLIQRGTALREQGFYEAARTAFKEALRMRSRPAELRHLALVGRGMSYAADGKKALARKDYERVLAENSTYSGLMDLLTQVAN